MSFRDIIRDISPPWLRRPWGERFLYAHGLILDIITSWAFEGVNARFPDEAPPDALPFIGRDRVIHRGFDEPDDVYVRRLKKWLDGWRVSGNPFALMEEIRAYLYGFAIRIRYVNDRGTWFTVNPDGSYEVVRLAGNWNWDGKYPTEARTRFWLIIYPLSTGLWATDRKYGDGGRWGDGRTWGTTATREQVQTIRAIIRERKTAGSRCVNVIVAFDDSSFDPTGAPGAPLPDGTWGKYGVDSHSTVDGHDYITRLPSRNPTARYFRGSP